MFIGEYSHSVDEKGRLAIPVKFRSDLVRGAVVTKGLDSCLTVYTMEGWQSYAEKLASLPSNQADARAHARNVLAGAMDVEVDKQGRIILPDYLRRYAGISKKAVVTGLYNRFEIWDEVAWQKYKASMEASSNEIAERLGTL